MKSIPMYDVLVIGAGVSGLSAAVELVSRGLKVLVCEKAPHAGGRTSSFFDKPTSEWVDNGQHLMMGCYTAARRYLQIIGSEHLAELQPVLNIPYYRAGSERTELRCLPLPSLLHAGSGLIRFSAIPFRERAADNKCCEGNSFSVEPKGIRRNICRAMAFPFKSIPLCKKRPVGHALHRYAE